MFPARRVLSAAVLLAVVAACSSSPAATTKPTAKASVATGGSGAGATPPANATLPAGVSQVPVQADADPWALTAIEFDPAKPTRYGFWCPPGGTPRTIWGTDLYTHDSSACTAGVHVGAITIQSGGFVIIEMRPGAAAYTASTRNGIDSQEYGAWSGSYVVVRY